MSDWLLSIAGTPAGAFWASVFALVSAAAHAFFGALQKGSHDPWLSRGAIDMAFIVVSLPLMLVVPVPDAGLFLALIGAVVIHFIYKLAVALAYTRGAYTAVYPVIRGTGPLITVAGAIVIFNESYTALQWLGVLALSGGLLLLALRNVAEDRMDPARLRLALMWAVAAGLMVAAYTTFDAWAIRKASDPLTFVVWLFFLSSFDFALIGLLRWRQLRVPLAPLARRGLTGALVGYVSFGGVMLATRIDSVGEAAVLRETSVVFAAIFGWFLLGERVGPRRLALMVLIALGAVLVEFGRGAHG